jgi:hypothetical protein
MTRWTLVALAITLSACNKGERDLSSQSKSDSAAAAASSAADSAMSSDTQHMGTMTSDTATTKPSTAERAASKQAAGTKPATPATTEATRANGPSGAEAMTGVRAASAAARELSADQVKQLQSALKKDGCYSGTADGVGGPGTQRAIECGLKKYKLAPDDVSGLYRKLGLKF